METISREERERLYSPSKWSKRYKAEELLERFMKFCTEVTEKAQKTIKCELNVPYGTTERTKYDIYGTDLPKDAPIFVFIHGGYWQECSKDISGYAAPLLVKNKIKVIIVEYDLCPDVEMEDIVAEIKSAVAQILKYAADSGCKSVWVSGHSAGAYLAGCLLHDDNWIKRMTQQGYFPLLKGLVLISGIYDLSPLFGLNSAAALNLTKELIKKISICTLDEQKGRRIRGLKVIVTVGDCDSPAFMDQSRQYAQKIIPLVDNVEYLFLPDIDHFNIIENLLDPNYALAKLILNVLKPDANTRLSNVK